jgi:uncharacterized protein (DUF433 family)
MLEKRKAAFRTACRATCAVLSVVAGAGLRVKPPRRDTSDRPGTPRVRCYSVPVIDWSSCPAVQRDPDRYSGAWVFAGTRVPLAALFENVEGGMTLDEFVETFPGVTMDQVRAVLSHAARSALASA